MTDAPAVQSLQRRLPLQFSLSGMLLTFCLVFSVGLSYWRWKGVDFSSAMLLSFAIWLIMGLIQRMRVQTRQWHILQLTPHSERWGVLLQSLVPSWAIVLLLVVTCSNISVRYGLFGPGWQTWLTDLLFYLAIIGAYWQPQSGHAPSSHRSRIITSLFSFVLILVAVFWITEIIAGESEIPRMVYSAIRKIERSQVTTWAGQPFSPSPLAISRDELQQILNPLAVASVALSAAVGVSGLILYGSSSTERFRWALFAVLMVCFGIVVAGMYRCWKVGTDDLSPLHIPQLKELEWNHVALLSILIVSFAAAVGLHFASTAKPALSRDFQRFPSETTPLYERMGVMAFGLCAVLGKICQNFWQNAVGFNAAPVESWIFDPHVVWLTVSRLCMEYVVHMPTAMIHLAAVGMLVRCLWREQYRSSCGASVWSFDPVKFITASTIALLMLLTAAPIAVWWGVVTTLLR